MNTDVNEKLEGETKLQTPPTETPTNENGETPTANNDAATANNGEETANNGEAIANKSLQIPPLAENATTLANNDNATANDDDVVVKKGSRVAYTCNLGIDEDLHVQPQIDDLIKFGVVDNKADFLRKAIDVYLNYNNVCTENKLEQPLILPVPDGKNGSITIAPKLLKNSLFKSLSKLPTF